MFACQASLRDCYSPFVFIWNCIWYCPPSWPCNRTSLVLSICERRSLHSNRLRGGSNPYCRCYRPSILLLCPCRGKSVRCTLKVLVLVGDKEWDGHPGTGFDAGNAVAGARKNDATSPLQRSQDKRHRGRPHIHHQWPVHLKALPSQDSDR